MPHALPGDALDDSLLRFDESSCALSERRRSGSTAGRLGQSRHYSMNDGSPTSSSARIEVLRSSTWGRPAIYVP